MKTFKEYLEAVPDFKQSKRDEKYYIMRIKEDITFLKQEINKFGSLFSQSHNPSQLAGVNSRLDKIKKEIGDL